MKHINLNESLGYLFHTINLIMKKKLEGKIKKFGLTSTHQFGILVLLSRQELSQKEISQFTLADEPATTRIINRMIKKMLLIKIQSKEDKRKKVVSITQKGRQMLEEVVPHAVTANLEITQNLHKREADQLLRLLNKIHKNS